MRFITVKFPIFSYISGVYYARKPSWKAVIISLYNKYKKNIHSLLYFLLKTFHSLDIFCVYNILLFERCSITRGTSVLFIAK